MGARKSCDRSKKCLQREGAQCIDPEVRQPIYALGSSKVRENPLHEIEKALAARGDVGAVLDVARRPVALGRDVASLVEQGIERLEDERFVPRFFRLAHLSLLIHEG
jgi:hypothetical protein